MNWKVWLKGLFAASVGGAAAGVTQVASTTGTVNKGTGAVAGVGALLSAAAYLLKSPIPDSNPVLTQKEIEQATKEKQ